MRKKGLEPSRSCERQPLKLVRSAEEITALEYATAAGERAIVAMIASAVPSAQHQEVWLRMFAAATDATGETPLRLAIRAGNEANTSTGGPMLEELRAGQYCLDLVSTG